MKESIRNALANELAVLNDDIFDGEILRSTLYDAGYTCVAEEFSHAEEYALAAAIEYFDGDIEQAIAAIERGNYRHYPDAYDHEGLGMAIIDEECDGHNLLEIVRDYIDYEALGKDMERDMERGKFTNFGYFAPERW